MAKDIVPELLERIESDFARRFAESNTVDRVGKLIDAGQATYKEERIRNEVGQILADVLRQICHRTCSTDGCILTSPNEF